MNIDQWKERSNNQFFSQSVRTVSCPCLFLMLINIYI